MGLKFFNKDAYTSLGDALKDIKQELLSLCPKDSSNVRWQRGADGMSAIVKAGQSAADEGGAVLEESTSQPSGYNGYFTLKDVSTYNEDGTVKEYRVAVCDGETWDPETETSNHMSVVVNSGYIYIESCIFTPQNYDTINLVVVKEGTDVAGLNIPKLYPIWQANQHYNIGLAMYKSLPNEFLHKVVSVYLLGEISNAGTSNKIIQRHKVGMGNGIPRVWMAQQICSMEIENDDTDTDDKG